MENTMANKVSGRKVSGKKVSGKHETFSGQVRAWTANIYLIIMLGIYPLFVVNGYINLVYKKWALFLYATAVAILVSLMWYLPERAGRIRNGEKAVWLPMDWFVLGYFACAVVSYVGAADRAASLWGVDTWYTGFVSQILFIGIYWIISCGYVKMPYLDILSAASGIMISLMIILQRFGVDVLHLYRGFGDDVKLDFVATLGQVTWTSSYVSILLIAGMGVYFCLPDGKKKVYTAKVKALGEVYFCLSAEKKRILLGVCIGIGFAAEMVLNCDSGMIALMAAVMIMVWLAVGNRERVMRVTEIIMIALFSAAVIGIGERFLGGRMIPIDAIYLKVAQSVLLYPVLAVVAVFYFLVKTGKLRVEGGRKSIWIVRGVYLGLIGLGIVGVAVLFVLHGKGYFSGSPTENYFRFTVWWGNSRGFIWRTGAAVFGDFNIWRKLFGCGPDGFTPYAYRLMGDAINEFWHNQLVPNVHNEWFNAVINYGLVGGIAYLGIFVSSAYVCMKSALESEGEERAVMFGAGLAAAGYVFHNVLCYQQIIGTPFIFALMGIGAAKVRRK